MGARDMFDIDVTTEPDDTTDTQLSKEFSIGPATQRAEKDVVGF
jgi:hypothetical protein